MRVGGHRLRYYLRAYPFLAIQRLTHKKRRKIYRRLRKSRKTIRPFAKAMEQYALLDKRYELFVDAYKSRAVRCVRQNDVPRGGDSPVLLCVVQNDLVKVRRQVAYHRGIGVKHFVYVDNLSTDGTFEWLSGQPDISLFTVDAPFSSRAKNAWRRQAMDAIGYDRWYLVLDSDEFFSYPGIEQKPIGAYIAFLERNQMECAFSPMIDMYAGGSLFGGEDESFLADHCYFDTDTYASVRRAGSVEIRGGPRKRLFYGQAEKGPLLSKYALIRARREYIVGTHCNYPCHLNFCSRSATAFLLHYKFLPYEDAKYREIIRSERYSNNSSEYKAYFTAYRDNPGLSFYYDRSARLRDSMDLLRISVADRRFFAAFLGEAGRG